MQIANPATVSIALVQEIAARAGLAEKHIMFFLDDRNNQFRRDAAAKKIAENVAKNWKPYTWDLEAVTQDRDHHAFFCPSEILQDQLIPSYVRQAVGDNDSVIYLDSVFLSKDPIDVVSTLAHECRHAWQYYTDAHN